jgi:heme exporter protein A
MQTFEAKHLACIKGEQYLFRNLSFSLQAGQLAFIQGANGSGKSSLLKIVAGLGVANKGSVKTTATSKGYLGHKDGLRQLLTAKENIRLQATLHDYSIDENLLDEFLTQLQLNKVLSLPCQLLSQGQRRKVALCALLLKQHALWILDEPFTALDKTSCEWLQQQFLVHLKRGGMIIVASHAPLTIQTDVNIDLSKELVRERI